MDEFSHDRLKLPGRATKTDLTDSNNEIAAGPHVATNGQSIFLFSSYRPVNRQANNSISRDNNLTTKPIFVCSTSSKGSLNPIRNYPCYSAKDAR